MYLIAGVTASGKSSFATKLAKYIGGEIINGDSVQQYQGLPILTAQPNGNDCAQIPHHGYGYIGINEQSNVWDWLTYVHHNVRWLGHLDRPAILCGGSGMYLSALLNGLSRIPKSDPELLERLESFDSNKLKKLSYRLHFDSRDKELRDHQRVIRSLALRLKTGRGLSEWQDLPRQGYIDLPPTRVVIFLPPRDKLRAVVTARLNKMIETGVMDEIKTALQWPQKPSARLKVCGWKPLVELVYGHVSKKEALEKAVTETMQYAKRQSTWFRNQMPNAQIFHSFSHDVQDEAMQYLAQ